MHVRLAGDFFKKERENAYTDWRLALWRELFQNSIDQEVSEIRITLVERDGYVDLTFADNGPGMTRQVLEDVYFAIGATTKTGSNQIGGMGRARVLTCFAMQAYQIRSQDYLTIGCGGEYEVQDAPYTRGCHLSIEVDDATRDDLESKLRRFLGESRIGARVYLNGNLLPRLSALIGRHARDLIVDDQRFAKVYINKSAATHRVIVRVNGVSMFTTRTSAKGQIVVELEPSISRQVLTSNRDGLRGDYRYMLDDFLREIAVDTKSAMRERFARHTTVARGGGMRHIRNKTRAQPMLPREFTARSTSATWNASEPQPIISEPQPIISGHVGSIVATSNDYETRSLDSWLSETFGDIYIFDEADNAKVRRVIPTYMPTSWQTTVVNGRTIRNGGHKIRVLLMWQTAIAYALEVAMEPLDLDTISYAVGFLFDDASRADHRNQDNGHIFSLCPVNKDGKLDYAITNRASIKRLMALAKHEVTHISVSWHSEDFANMRELIDERFFEAECLRRIKKALGNIPELED